MNIFVTCILTPKSLNNSISRVSSSLWYWNTSLKRDNICLLTVSCIVLNCTIIWETNSVGLSEMKHTFYFYIFFIFFFYPCRGAFLFTPCRGLFFLPLPGAFFYPLSPWVIFFYINGWYFLHKSSSSRML